MSPNPISMYKVPIKVHNQQAQKKKKNPQHASFVVALHCPRLSQLTSHIFLASVKKIPRPKVKLVSMVSFLYPRKKP